jgi:hypothetical protein
MLELLERTASESERGAASASSTEPIRIAIRVAIQKARHIPKSDEARYFESGKISNSSISNTSRLLASIGGPGGFTPYAS